jgi:hypothetical protein
VRTVGPNKSIGPTGVATSCRDDKLEARSFLALFGIRGDFRYIVFCFALMGTDLGDGLRPLCCVICYSSSGSSVQEDIHSWMKESEHRETVISVERFSDRYDNNCCKLQLPKT